MDLSIWKHQVAPFGSVELRADGAKFALSNAHVVAEFDGSGLLAAVTTLQDKVRTPARLEFWEYGTTRKSDKSGAYLFLPGECAIIGFLPGTLVILT